MGVLGPPGPNGVQGRKPWSSRVNDKAGEYDAEEGARHIAAPAHTCWRPRPFFVTPASLARDAQAHARAGDWEASRATWQRCLAAARGAPPHGWLLGSLRAAAALGDVQAARRAAAQLLERYPDSEAARQSLLRLLIQTRSLGALAEEAANGSLREGAEASALLPHFRALLALEDHAAARGVLDRLLPLATTPAELHALADRASICFAPDPARVRWNAAAAALTRLPPSLDPARDGPVIRTLLLRRDIATRDYAGFLRRWRDGGATLPQWTGPLARIAERLAAPGFPDRTRRKIFGIGLSKTGTTSLAAALEILGWQTAHFRNPITHAVIEHADFDLFDALNDGPVSAHFEVLHAKYPNAQFICTTRPFASWQDSVRAHRIRVRGTDVPRDIDAIAAAEGPDSPLAARLPIHDSIWRHADLASVHANWADRVDRFFADKPGKLLRFSVFEGDGWEALCGFLKAEVPAASFPHSNSRRAEMSSLKKTGGAVPAPPDPPSLF